MCIDSLSIISVGLSCMIFATQLTNLVGKIESSMWKVCLGDTSNDFKSYFSSKKTSFVRLLGLVLLFTGVIDLLLSISYGR